MDENVNRAELARQIFENQVFIEALDAMKSALADRWIATRDTEAEERERAWKHRKFLDIFESTLRGYIERGKLHEPIDRP